MTRRNIEKSAARLLDTSRPGVANALADIRRHVICVFLDPSYWQFVDRFPSKFDGFKVIVERRLPTISGEVPAAVH